MGKINIAAFDFDGTITTKDTFLLFVKFSRGKLVFWSGLFIHFFHIIGYKLNIVPNWQLKQKLFKYYFAGMPIEEFDSFSEKFSNEIDKHLRKDMVSRIALHKNSGYTNLIISASIENWIRPWANKNMIHFVIGTKVEVADNNRLTGNFFTLNCYGIEKVNRLLEIYPERKSYVLYAYGDSKGDKQLIEFADFGCHIKDLKQQRVSIDTIN